MSVKFHEAYCLDSQQDQLLWFDDFLGDQIQDEWDSSGSAGGSATVIDQQTGGIIRLTTNNVNGNTWTVDWNDIRTLHIDKRISMEYRLKLAQTGLVTGFTYLLFDANNCVNFQYESNIGTNWRIRCRNGGVITIFDSGIAADTSYHIFRIECFPTGEVHFYIDGAECNNSPITTNIPNDAGDYLQPRLYITTRENVAKTVDYDYVVVRQEI